jgi:ubiquinone biosynthesis protein
MSRNRRLEQVRTELETLKLTRSEKRRPVKSTPREGFGERLATALLAMSPLFALFGRYLAGRTDRLPLRDCRDLDGILISVEPTSMSRVGLLLSSQLGGPLTDHFGAFEEARQTDLLYQWHDAELLDGTAVTVKLIRPEAWEMVDSELELLPALEQLDLESGDAALLVEDFVVWLDRQLDLGRELIGLDQLAAEVGTFDAFEIPTRLPELCSCQVVTTHRTDGETLADLIDRPGTHRPALARHLCQVWLQQALLEGSCPEGPLAENLRVLSTERFAITGGLVTTLDSRWRRHLIVGRGGSGICGRPNGERSREG